MNKSTKMWQRLCDAWFGTHFIPQNKAQILAYLKSAQTHNVLSFEVLEMIEGVFQVADQHVRDVMIPRAQMTVLPSDAPLKTLMALIVESGHSRFPVVDDNNRDSVQGILLAKDLLNYCSRQDNEPFDINDLLRPPVFIPESKRLNVLLKDFRTSRNHMAMVIDEYGGIAGLVTIEDVIEKIVGDIDDEFDQDPENFINPDHDNHHVVKALVPVDVFNDYFHTDFDCEEFDTIGGVLLKAFGRLPDKGDKIKRKGLEFEVLDADRRRIYKIRVSPLK